MSVQREHLFPTSHSIQGDSLKALDGMQILRDSCEVFRFHPSILPSRDTLFLWLPGIDSPETGYLCGSRCCPECIHSRVILILSLQINDLRLISRWRY